MKILIFSEHFPPYRGGLENYVEQLADSFISLGHDVFIATYQKIKNPKEGKLKIISLPGKPILGKTYNFPTIWKKSFKSKIEYLKEIEPDIIITNTRFFTSTLIGACLYRKLKHHNKTKYIHVEHGNVHVIHKNFLVTSMGWLWDQTIGRFIFKTADVVVGISKPSANFAKKLGAKNTTIIHNSIDTNFFQKRKSNYRNKFKIKSDEFVIVNGIGRLIYAKGLHDTIEAVKDMKNVRLIIIGDGPYKGELMKLAIKNKVKTIFTEELGRDEIVKWLSTADAFVNPSYSEGLPTCVLEAGAVGVPTIATNVGGTSEIIENKKNGFLIKPNSPEYLRNKIKYLIDNKAISLKFRKNIAKKIRNEFDSKQVLEKWEKIL